MADRPQPIARTLALGGAPAALLVAGEPVLPTGEVPVGQVAGVDLLDPVVDHP